MSVYFFFFKQKTAYEMRISDWSSDVCSSDLHRRWRLGPTMQDVGRRRDGVRGGRQMQQRIPVNLALEVDHVLQRIPEIDPTPAIELGLGAGIKAHVMVVAEHPQQKPDLLLTNADRKSTRLNSSH